VAHFKTWGLHYADDSHSASARLLCPGSSIQIQQRPLAGACIAGATAVTSGRAELTASAHLCVVAPRAMRLRAITDGLTVGTAVGAAVEPLDRAT